jgi:biopolymer transport protein ExbB/biopolymer transport protein TolQ
MKRGLWSLATIASTAPWVGFVGTLLGIVNSFPGMGIDKRTALAIVSGRLSESLVPTAFGVMVALWCYKYLLSKVEAFDSDMESVSIQLINQLRRLSTN